MTLYTAVRYRNDMSVFDHHTDGIVRPAAAASKPAPLTLIGSRKTFSVSQVRLMRMITLMMIVWYCESNLDDDGHANDNDDDDSDR